jgi:hypothetical protein
MFDGVFEASYFSKSIAGSLKASKKIQVFFKYD